MRAEAYNGFEVWLEDLTPGNEPRFREVAEAISIGEPFKAQIGIPKCRPFQICIKQSNRKLIIKDDFEVVISFDGRSIHPIYIKHRSHMIHKIQHVYGNEGEGVGDTVYKCHFCADNLELRDDQLLTDEVVIEPLPLELGTIKIQLFRGKIGIKSASGNRRTSAGNVLMHDQGGRETAGDHQQFEGVVVDQISPIISSLKKLVAIEGETDQTCCITTFKTSQSIPAEKGDLKQQPKFTRATTNPTEFSLVRNR